MRPVDAHIKVLLAALAEEMRLGLISRDEYAAKAREIVRSAKAEGK